jgi:PsbP
VKKTILLTLFAFVALPCLATEDVVETLHFKANSFSIAPLEETSGSTNGQVLAMSLPASEGFAPNVNVQIQPFKGTLKEYVDLSKKQFTAAKFALISEKSTDTVHTFEYTGLIQGNKLHFYQKAEMGRGKVYLVTGTAKETQWEAVGAKLKKCIDSFKRD